MQYLLTEDEYKKLVHDDIAERLRAEYQKRLDAKVQEVSELISRVLQQYAGRGLSNPWASPDFQSLVKDLHLAVQTASQNAIEKIGCIPPHTVVNLPQ